VRKAGEASYRKLSGVTPFTSDSLAAGSWEVSAELEGYEGQTGSVEVAPGAVAAIALALEKAEPAGDGFVQLVIVPFADVYVNGKLIEKEAKRIVASVPSTPGKRNVVELRHPSFGTYKFDRVAVTAGDTTDLGRYDFKFGTLRVFCKPAVAADVFVDGKKESRQTPFLSDRVGAATHKVGVVKEGWIVKEVFAIDAAGAQKKLRASGSRGEVEVTVPAAGETKLQFVLEKKG
jgi:hypothetical protein